MIGFPKYGTGALRSLFAKSEEIAMLGYKNKDLFTSKSSEEAFAMLDSDFKGLFESEQVKYPTNLKTNCYKSTKRSSYGSYLSIGKIHYILRSLKIFIAISALLMQELKILH